VIDGSHGSQVEKRYEKHIIKAPTTAIASSISRAAWIDLHQECKRAARIQELSEPQTGT
jgi:hypothetical protein